MVQDGPSAKQEGVDPPTLGEEGEGGCPRTGERPWARHLHGMVQYFSTTRHPVMGSENSHLNPSSQPPGMAQNSVPRALLGSRKGWKKGGLVQVRTGRSLGKRLGEN